MEKFLHTRGLKLYVDIFKLVCNISKGKDLFSSYSLVLSMMI